MFRFGRGLACIGIALAMGLFAGPRPVDAAFNTLGIIIDQTILMPTGDPQFQYDFKASLVAMNELRAGDYIVFDDIPDFASARFSAPFLSSSVFQVTTSRGSAANLSNVLFTYSAPFNVSNPGETNISLGDFIVATTDNFDASNVPARLLVQFVYMTRTTSTIPPNEKNFGTGLTPFPSVVPEPSSAALIAIGLPVAWAVARGRRRRAA